MAAQAALEGIDISLSKSVIVLAHTISSTIFLAGGQNLFQAGLKMRLATKAPKVDPAVVLGNGVSGLAACHNREVWSEVVRAVLKAYNAARIVF